MKLTKKLLSLLLAVLTAAMLLVPAVAQELPPPEYTLRLEGFLYAKLEEEITLAPVAVPPEGVEVELLYQWYYSSVYGNEEYFEPIEGATQPQLKTSLSFAETDWVSAHTFMFTEEHYYFLQTYYIAEDGTKVFNNDYTTVIYRYRLEDIYQYLFKQMHLGFDNGWESALFKVLFFPLTLPLYLLELLYVADVKQRVG